LSSGFQSEIQVGVFSLIVCRLSCVTLSSPPGAFPVPANKKAAAKDAPLERFLGAAALPIGPSLDQRRGLAGRADRPFLYKWHANRLAQKKRFRINRENLIA